MDEREWQSVLERVSQDAGGIVRSQRVLSDVNRVLDERRAVEEDFIFRDAFGQDVGKARVVDIDGVRLTIRNLHRRGLAQTDIKGADLLYEIVGEKFALIQYKTPDSRGRVANDAEQLNELRATCPHPCSNWAGSPILNCGAWYSLQSSTDSVYMPACDAAAVFGHAKSRSAEAFGRGVPGAVFQHLFGRCWTGARTAPVDVAGFMWSALEGDQVVFSVVQAGTFGRW